MTLSDRAARLIWIGSRMGDDCPNALKAEFLREIVDGDTSHRARFLIEALEEAFIQERMDYADG